LAHIAHLKLKIDGKAAIGNEVEFRPLLALEPVLVHLHDVVTGRKICNGI